MCTRPPSGPKMGHLYANADLWEHVSMVAFAEHYVGCEEASDLAQPLDVFRWQRALQERQHPDRPIYCGVVLNDWEQALTEGALEETLAAFREEGIDYVRLHCNFGTADEIGDASRLADDAPLRERFRRLAQAAKSCQNHGLVPLALMQVPWRESKARSEEYFTRAIGCFADVTKEADVQLRRLILETRPPIGMSAREEMELNATARTSLGLELGREMFDILDEAFDDDGDRIAGFCVAGGSTKGAHPTAMEDDAQNAVRQGLRQRAMQQWGYELCFWEMGAKLMLQPEVGRLWANGDGSGRDEARDLFCANAKALSDEIAEPIDR